MKYLQNLKFWGDSAHSKIFLYQGFSVCSMTFILCDFSLNYVTIFTSVYDIGTKLWSNTHNNNTQCYKYLTKVWLLCQPI